MIINPTNRDDIRERAIQTTSEIVLKCGNLSVRMDDVAQELSVSKRTLYERRMRSAARKMCFPLS